MGLGDLLGGLFDKEKIVRETIQSALENVAEELGCGHKELFIMISPTNAEFDFKCYIYKVTPNTPPKLVREISLKEILGGEDDE
jgi:hypothetical protein